MRAIAAAALGITCGLVIAEVMGRTVFGFGPLPRWAQTFVGMAGYELHPGEQYDYVSASGEFATRVRLNSRGLRDIEHEARKPPGVVRILILGDSFAQACEVALEETFPRRLDSLLDRRRADGRRIEVINGGHQGLGTTQEYLYYILEGRRYRPDVVVLGVYLGNDLVDNHAPLAAAWRHRETIEYPYFSPDERLHQPGLAPPRRVLRWLRLHLFTAHLAANALTRGGRGDRIVVGTRPGHGVPSDPETRRVPLGLYLPPDAEWRDAWRVTAHALGELAKAVTNDGGRLVVFVIPDRRQVDDEAWEDALAELPAVDRSRADRDRPQARMMELIASAGLPGLDLLPLLRDVPAAVYFPLDGHFNALGHEVTAEALGAWLADQETVAENLSAHVVGRR